MVFITKNNTMKKGVREDLAFDKDAFLLASSISDDHFANEMNWEKVALVYKSPDKIQREIVILKDNFSRGFYHSSERAKTGNWTLEEIRINDFDGDEHVISRPSIPAVEDCDIAINRVIAPTASITKAIFENNDDLLVNGDFESGLLSPWTNSTSIPSIISNQLFFSKASGEAAVINQTINTVPGRTYVISYEVIQSTMAGANPQPAAIATKMDDTLIAIKTVDNGAAVYSLEFVAEESQTKIAIGVNGNKDTYGTITFDNLSVKLTSPKMVSVQIEEGLNEHYPQGFQIKLWDETANAYVSSEVYSIESVSGEILNLDKPIPDTVDLATMSILAKYPDYSVVKGIQRMKYEYIGINE